MTCGGRPMCAAGCGRHAAPRHKYCWGDLKRRTRGQPLSSEKPLAEPYSSPFERLTAAALAYADVEDGDEEAFARARDRLRKAAVAYARSLPLRTERVVREPARQAHRWAPAGAQLRFWSEGEG